MFSDSFTLISLRKTAFRGCFSPYFCTLPTNPYLWEEENLEILQIKYNTNSIIETIKYITLNFLVTISIVLLTVSSILVSIID